jgi:hypothetical protein
VDAVAVDAVAVDAAAVDAGPADAPVIDGEGMYVSMILLRTEPWWGTYELVWVSC